MNNMQTPGDMAPLTEDEILYYYDGPMILTLQQGDDLWIATCFDGSGPALNYAAVRITREELEAVTNGSMSVRGAFLNKPWRPIDLDKDGFAFKEGGGDSVPGNYLAAPGVGLEVAWKGLPDQMPGADGLEEDIASPF